MSSPTPDLPTPVASLLSRLRWPATADGFGLAAWSRHVPDSPGGLYNRTDAWVRWTGQEIEARLTHTPVGKADRVLVARWDVGPTGEAQFVGARDNAGPLLEGRAISDFTEALAPMGAPSLLRLPSAPPRRPRP